MHDINDNITELMQRIKEEGIDKVYYEKRELINDLLKLNEIITPENLNNYNLIKNQCDSTNKSLNKCHPIALTIALNTIRNTNFLLNSRSLRGLTAKSGIKIINKLNQKLNFDLVTFFSAIEEPNKVLELIALQFYY